MSPPHLLSIYLQDHHAGAVAGANLARRAAAANEGNEYGDELRRIAAEIADDKDTLEQLMDELDVGRDRIKDHGAWASEKLGRLKRNGRWLDYSPLSRMLELEGLMLGVNGKLGLWRALERSHGEVIGGVSIAELAARAEDQRSRLDALRLRAAKQALTSD